MGDAQSPRTATDTRIAILRFTLAVPPLLLSSCASRAWRFDSQALAGRRPRRHYVTESRDVMNG